MKKRDFDWGYFVTLWIAGVAITLQVIMIIVNIIS